MVPELKPCPFCGGPAKHNEGGNSVYGRLWWRVWCEACNFEIYDKEEWHDFAGPMSGLLKGKPMECIETWNSRAEAALSAAEPQPAPSVAVKALQAAEEELSRIDCIPMVTETTDTYAQLELAKVYAGRGAHEARKALSALTAQVQGVAPLQNVRSEVTHEDICDTHEGGTCNCDWSAADEYQAHPDDIAVDRFAAVMKAKLAKKRDEGRSGWEDKDECSQIFLSQLLREHVEKGDPVDVGNLAMMLHQRGERIASLLEALQGE